MICKYCSAKFQKYDITNHLSKCIADVKVDRSRFQLVLYDGQTTYEIPAKYCPICGRDLLKPSVRNTEQDYSNTIRDNVKYAMRAYGFSLSRLSKEAGIAKSTISDFLNGRTNTLSAGKVAMISDVLSIPIESLFLPNGQGKTYDEAVAGY